jgi:hypothetical protein
MWDAMMSALLLAGFAAAVGYVHACVRVTQSVNNAPASRATDQPR